MTIIMKHIILILLLFICSCKDKQVWQYNDELEVIETNECIGISHNGFNHYARVEWKDEPLRLYGYHSARIEVTSETLLYDPDKYQFWTGIDDYQFEGETK